jgi:IS30 family transposase
MRTFKQLTRTKRIQLETYLKLKLSKKEIAQKLGVHISTVYREINRGLYEHRNSDWTTEIRYSCDIAQEKYEINLAAKGKPLKIGNDYEFANYIEDRIINGKLSPLAVLGEIKYKQMQFKTSISVTTLYSYIEKDIFENLTLIHLPMKEKKKKRKRKLTTKRAPRGTSIEERPKEINDRITFGHWEMDCVCGSTKTTLLVLTERLTRKEIIFKMPNQKAESVHHCLNIIEHKYGKNFKKVFKSITVDNGSEFSDVGALEKSKFGKNNKRTKLYYCHPYSSYERGTNERINREIRRLIPKGSNLANYTNEEISDVEKWVNDYPRQVLNFNTSANLYNYYLQQIL